MKKAAVKKAIASAIPKETVFPLSGDYRLRILCKRGVCQGYLELTPAELAAYAGPVIACPTCGGEFSGGMKGNATGDKCKLVGIIFQGLTNRTWCNTFAVELVRKA